MSIVLNPFTGQFDISGTSGGGGGGGTVTSVGLADSTNTFNIINSPVTNSGTLTLTSFKSQSANTFLAAPDGSSGSPSFRTIVAGDIPTLPYVSTSLTSSHILVGNASNIATNVALSGDGSLSNTGTLTINSVGGATSTEIGYLIGATSNIQTQINNKAGKIIPSTNQMVYVNFLTGNDSTGDGSYSEPFQTVAHAMTTITDATSNKPYVIALQAARQIESTDVFMKPYTFIVGQMQRATYMRINGGSLKPDLSHATVNSWVGLANLYWGGSSTIDWDLQALGGANCDFVIQDCTITGNFNYTGRNSGGGDYLEIYNGIVFGPFTGDSILCQIQGVEIEGTFDVSNTQGVSFIGQTFDSSVFNSNISFSGPNVVNLNGCSYASGVTVTTTGNVTVNSFRGLPVKSNRSLSGGTTLVNIDDATTVPYNPSVPSNWSPTPSDVSDALDQLATKASEIVELFTLNSSDVSNGYVTLTNTPTSGSSVVLLVQNCPCLFFGSDYTLISNRVTWTGFGLDGILASGDNLTVLYN